MEDAVYHALTLTGGLAEVLLAWLVLRAIRQDREERRALTAKVEHLETDRMNRLEKKLDDHLAVDRPGEVALELNHLTEALKENTSLQREAAIKIARIDKELAAAMDRIASLSTWVANINEAYQSHLKDHSYDNRGRRKVNK